jgi:heme iron utilization protein
MSQSSSPDKPHVLRETDEAARTQARAFMRESAHGALATLEPKTGWPLASRVSLAADTDGVPLILISRLSAHYGALENDARCSLLLGEAGDGDPLRHPRITVVCRASKVPQQQRMAAKAQFLQRHPGAEIYADFTDFDFWRLNPERASLNAGFGKAYTLSAQDLLHGSI